MSAIAKDMAITRDTMKSFRADVNVILRSLRLLSLSLLACASEENCNYEEDQYIWIENTTIATSGEYVQGNIRNLHAAIGTEPRYR